MLNSRVEQKTHIFIRTEFRHYYCIYSTSERYFLRGHLKVRRLFLQCGIAANKIRENAKKSNKKVRIAYRPEWCIMTCCYLYGMGNKAAIMPLYTHSVHVPSPNRLILQQIFLVLVTYTLLFSSVLTPSVKFHCIYLIPFIVL